MRKSLSYYKEYFLNRACDMHGDKFVYNMDEFISMTRHKISIICPIHGKFMQVPCKHLGKFGCIYCFYDSLNKKDEFIDRANKIHNNFYKYDKIEYKNQYTKIVITCILHGDFTQTPDNHLNDHGCPQCGRISRAAKISRGNKNFIERSSIIHNYKFDYSKVLYKNGSTKVIIICPEHGQFEQRPDCHLNGNGCDKCSSSYKYTADSYIRKAKEIHGEFYNYDKINYHDIRSSIIITCPNHGDFIISAAYFLYGPGCIKCNKNYHKSQNLWLDQLGIDKDKRDICLPNLRKKRVDGFDPDTNTVYEFHGDYWHGNPKKYNPDDLNERNKLTFDQLYQLTIERENLIKSCGYNLITIWESDWKKMNKIKGKSKNE